MEAGWSWSTTSTQKRKGARPAGLRAACRAGEPVGGGPIVPGFGHLRYTGSLYFSSSVARFTHFLCGADTVGWHRLLALLFLLCAAHTLFPFLFSHSSFLFVFSLWDSLPPIYAPCSSVAVGAHEALKWAACDSPWLWF